MQSERFLGSECNFLIHYAFPYFISSLTIISIPKRIDYNNEYGNERSNILFHLMKLSIEQRTALGFFPFSKTHLRKLLFSSTALNSNSSTKWGSRESQRKLDTVLIERDCCGCELERRDEERHPETTLQRPSPVTVKGEEFSGEEIFAEIVCCQL